MRHTCKFKFDVDSTDMSWYSGDMRLHSDQDLVSIMSINTYENPHSHKQAKTAVQTLLNSVGAGLNPFGMALN